MSSAQYVQFMYLRAQIESICTRKALDMFRFVRRHLACPSIQSCLWLAAIFSKLGLVTTTPQKQVPKEHWQKSNTTILCLMTKQCPLQRIWESSYYKRFSHWKWSCLSKTGHILEVDYWNRHEIIVFETFSDVHCHFCKMPLNLHG